MTVLSIGIDFDNTLIDYHALFFACALEAGLVGRQVRPGKQAVRDHVRSLEGGEAAWQRLQAEVYGHRIEQAGMMAGAGGFLEACRERGIRVLIISHKTERASQEPGLDLREAALRWMTGRGFFKRNGFNISRENVFFESLRQDKVTRIEQCGCTHFIDDLLEVLLDPAFPEHVARIHLCPSPLADASGPVISLASWQDIRDYFFTPLGPL